MDDSETLATAHARERRAARLQLAQLGRENESLSVQNAALERDVARQHAELEALRSQLKSARTEGKSRPGNDARDDASDDALIQKLLVCGDDVIREAPLASASCGTSNPLCVSAWPPDSKLVCVGTAAPSVMWIQWATGTTVADVRLPGPVLSVRPFPSTFDPNNAYLLASCMDGSCHFLEFSKNLAQARLVMSWRDHDSFVLDARTTHNNLDGELCFFCATVSRDKSCVISKITRTSNTTITTSATFERQKLRSFFFETCAESVAFVGPHLQLKMDVDKRDNHMRVVVATRKSSALTVCDVHANTKHNWSFVGDGRACSVLRGDGTVGFNVLRLEVSACGHFLLCLTDMHRHFVVAGGRVLRNFYGHTSDELSTPRAVWHPTGQFVLSNSQKDCETYVWCVASERIRSKLAAHTRSVRDLAHHPTANVLFTVSYDKTVHVWETGDQVQQEHPQKSLAHAQDTSSFSSTALSEGLNGAPKIMSVIEAEALLVAAEERRDSAILRVSKAIDVVAAAQGSEVDEANVAVDMKVERKAAKRASRQARKDVKQAHHALSKARAREN